MRITRAKTIYRLASATGDSGRFFFSKKRAISYGETLANRRKQDFIVVSGINPTKIHTTILYARRMR